MTCDICGSKKNVKAFYGYMRKQWYKKCRDCFDKAMARTPLPEALKEAEWKRGKTSMEKINNN